MMIYLLILLLIPLLAGKDYPRTSLRYCPYCKSNNIRDIATNYDHERQCRDCNKTWGSYTRVN
jgi:hypothetical protein